MPKFYERTSARVCMYVCMYVSVCTYGWMWNARNTDGTSQRKFLLNVHLTLDKQTVT
jgi:hypothetical protein